MPLFKNADGSLTLGSMSASLLGQPGTGTGYDLCCCTGTGTGTDGFCCVDAHPAGTTADITCSGVGNAAGWQVLKDCCNRLREAYVDVLQQTYIDFPDIVIPYEVNLQSLLESYEPFWQCGYRWNYSRELCWRWGNCGDSDTASYTYTNGDGHHTTVCHWSYLDLDINNATIAPSLGCAGGSLWGFNGYMGLWIHHDEVDDVSLLIAQWNGVYFYGAYGPTKPALVLADCLEFEPAVWNSPYKWTPSIHGFDYAGKVPVGVPIVLSNSFVPYCLSDAIHTQDALGLDDTDLGTGGPWPHPECDDFYGHTAGSGFDTLFEFGAGTAGLDDFCDFSGAMLTITLRDEMVGDCGTLPPTTTSQTTSFTTLPPTTTTPIPCTEGVDCNAVCNPATNRWEWDNPCIGAEPSCLCKDQNDFYIDLSIGALGSCVPCDFSDCIVFCNPTGPTSGVWTLSANPDFNCSSEPDTHCICSLYYLIGQSCTNPRDTIQFQSGFCGEGSEGQLPGWFGVCTTTAAP